MTDEAVAGLFGMLATMVGVAAGYALSFSRDRRLQKERFRELLVLLIHDLGGIGDTLSDEYRMAIDASSLEAFRQQGYIRMLAPELARELLATHAAIARINHLSIQANNVLDIIAARGEERKLGDRYYSMGQYFEGIRAERGRLAATQREAIPRLVRQLQELS